MGNYHGYSDYRENPAIDATSGTTEKPTMMKIKIKLVRLGDLEAV